MRMLRSSGLYSLEEMSMPCKFGGQGQAWVRLEDMTMFRRDRRKYLCLCEAGGNVHALVRLEKCPCRGNVGGNSHALVRPEEMAIPWQDWRKCECLGKAGGHGHALVRLEEMAVSWRDWRKWPSQPHAGTSPRQIYFFKGRLSSLALQL